MGITRISHYKDHHFLQNVVVYSSTALIFSLFWLNPFWIPLFSSSIVYLLNPKCVFIVGNLIVFLLIGEKKIFISSSSSSSSSPLENYSLIGNGDEEEEKVENEGECLDTETELPSPADEELNRRVDDYIAKVNKLRRIEAKLLQ